MTTDELQKARAARAAALRPAGISGEALRAWVRNLGFATLPELAVWSDLAPELLEEELAALSVVELRLWPGELRYCAVELLEYVYVCVGDRHPRRDYLRQARERRLSWLAAEVFTLLLEGEAWTSARLRDRMGAQRTSVLSLERALAELAASLKVLRVGRAAGVPLWRALVCALPRVPDAVDTVSLLQSAAALVTQRLDVAVCDTEEGLAEALAPLHSRARLHAALVGLEAARVITSEALDGRPAWRLWQPRHAARSGAGAS